MNLLTAQCSRQPDAIAEPDRWLALLPGWSLAPDGKSIARAFRFANYYQTMAFVDAVAEIAHAQDHHPEMLVGYAACTVSWTTHSQDGLTMNDVICAAQASALPEADGE